MASVILIDLVRYGHLLAVAVGLGAAALADMAALTGLRRKVPAEFLTILHAAHRMIWPAVAVMWVTGIALVGIRTGFAFSEFSPKLWAKLGIVTVLTLNAMAIGRLGLPLMTRGGGLARFTVLEMRAAALMGGLSSASWLLALAMGSSRYLAQAPALVFLMLLPVAYACAVYGSYRVLWLLRGEAPPRPASAPGRAPGRASTLQVSAPDEDGVRTVRIGAFPRRKLRAA